jgi:hypothetical protein
LYKETHNSKHTYKRLTQDDFENSSEGGEIIAYKSATEGRRIDATYYGHMGMSESEYYYFKGEVYFLYLKRYIYNMPPTESGYDSNKTIIEESRYYYSNNKMIRWIKPDGKYTNLESKIFTEEERKRSAEAARLLEMTK